ncbi:hypothetical protein BB560_004896 [Smittium megazygosporum]|uniref:Carboxymuconolactone decarboxylase-like domain-containing protein n=1 Tax=Smittium megazygosporum TaxID=133381 RepID=A0A2T9Z801_9FUNG|nr:hypothetical protein BB560_004896 [Smittium megazygosporum]
MTFSQFAFLERYIPELGSEATVNICVSAYMTANKASDASKLVNLYIYSLSQDKQFSELLVDENVQKESLVSDSWFEKLDPGVQLEISHFVAKIREYIIANTVNIGIPLCLVMFKELQDSVGEAIYSSLPKTGSRVVQHLELNSESGTGKPKFVIKSPEASADLKTENGIVASSDSSSSDAIIAEFEEYQQARMMQGKEYFGHVYGKVADKLLNNIHSFHPDMDYIVLANGYGDGFARETLVSKIELELAAVASLTVLNTPVQLFSHIRGAKLVGAPKNILDATIALSRELFLLL